MAREDKMRLGIEREALEEVLVKEFLHIFFRQVGDEGAVMLLGE